MPTKQAKTKKLAMEVKNLSFSYGNNRILQGASLEIENGKITTIMGANGCGKPCTRQRVSCGASCQTPPAAPR